MADRVSGSPRAFAQTDRARAIDLRTYLRPLDDSGSQFESREQMLRRAMVDHHRHLLGKNYKKHHAQELEELYALGVGGYACLAGRTQWLGGTPYAYSRACCQYNCAFSQVETVYDLVDVSWLLLNGCGVGFEPRSGTLHGYQRRIDEFVVVPSVRGKDDRGREANEETLPDAENGFTWTIKVGDSASAWCKAGGKLFSPRSLPARKLVLDFSEIRGPGGRLKGYGWICNGHEPLARAFRAFHEILNASAGNLLDEIQIMDVVNWWGTVLSSRRAAEICLLNSFNPRVGEFSQAKRNYWEGNLQRRQSNNTVLYWSKPPKGKIRELLEAADECGGDPGLCNAEAALRKCPWFKGLNPCGEILLNNKGFCNLTTNCLPRFGRDYSAMERAVWLVARANYRQTCTYVEDDVLSPAWGQTNAALRLCGVSLTGVTQCDWLTDYQIRRLRNAAVAGAYSMADELGCPRPKGITTMKPEGTQSKTLGGEDVGEITEGIHRPLGESIFNWINFSVHDPILSRLESAGYKVIPNPSDGANALACFPVRYRNVKFDHSGGKKVNLESATAQMDRYLRWNNLWCDFNVSCTVSYSPGELSGMADWIDENWDRGFVAVAALRRTDPTKTAKDLGHPYLPQEVVTDEDYGVYKDGLRPVDWSGLQGIYEIEAQSCENGVCPVK